MSTEEFENAFERGEESLSLSGFGEAGHNHSLFSDI